MSQTSLIPPLQGDGHGNYRIQIIGNSGTGKSTVGVELAAMLGVPFISLDTLFWNPSWKQTPVDEFRTKINAALEGCAHGWVVDGVYAKLLGNMIRDRATDVIWLDPPLMLYFPRLCLRTLLRLFGVIPTCSPGCDESVREVFFSSDSIVWWCLSNHWFVRKRETENLRVDGIHVGGKYRRIGGWGGELLAWKRSVRDMLQDASHDG